MSKKGIFEYTQYLDPRYEHLDKYVDTAYRGFWTPSRYEKLIKEVDAPHYHNRMEEVDKEAIARCILAIAIVEDKVKSFWPSLHKDLPQTVISDVGALFGMIETTHRRSYHSLGQHIGVDVTKINEIPVLRDRVKYLDKHTEKDPNIKGKKRVLKNLILFTALVERCSLFTQFYILMSYKNANKGLDTINALQVSTSSEEISHFNFGIDLVNIIKEEYPELWDEYLEELVGKNIQMAYDTELRLIDWFFEKGVPDHLTREEVVNFLNYNFNIVTEALGLDIKYPVDMDIYNEKNAWMLVKIHSREPDFFHNNVGGYNSEDEDISLDGFKF